MPTGQNQVVIISSQSGKHKSQPAFNLGVSRYKTLECNHLSSLFNVWLMQGKIPQECMQTVIVPVTTEPSDERNLTPGFIQLRTPARINICSAIQQSPGTKL